MTTSIRRKRIDTRKLKINAEAAAGNWQHFESFGWDHARELDDARNWTIVYTRNRDSNLLDESNAAAIEQALRPFMSGDGPDVLEEHHRHWACGWIDGFAIRVFRDGRITEAFTLYHDMEASLDDYPVLDEEDYSRREYEATLENLGSAALCLEDEYELPDAWKETVYNWFSNNNQSAVENRDDKGGCPTEDELREAFEALGYRRRADGSAKASV